MIVNNRQDGESPDQMSDADARAAAEAAGLAYRHIPVGPLGPETAAALAEAIDAADGPILAYCTSGTRSAAVWALTKARDGLSADEILSALDAGGYSLPQLRPMLEMLGAD